MRLPPRSFPATPFLPVSEQLLSPSRAPTTESNFLGILPTVEHAMKSSVFEADCDHLTIEMRRRGALGADTTITSALTRVLDAIIENDQRQPIVASDYFGPQLRHYVNEKIVGFSTAIMTNAGRPSMPVASCTVLPLFLNQVNALDADQFYSHSSTAFENAIGVGYHISEHLYPTPTLGIIRSELDRINRPLVAKSKRPVAAMLSIPATHRAIAEFLESFSRSEQGPLVTASVFVTEKLFEDARSHSYGEPSQEAFAARELLHRIAGAIHASGNPGIIFADRLASDNPTPQFPYVSVAPCAEVGLATGDACHFGYLNLPRMSRSGKFDWQLFSNATKVLVRSLDSAVDLTSNAILPYALVARRRRIGVCVTGLSDCLDLLGIDYDSEEALVFCQTLSERLDFESKLESIELARQRGPFPLFDTSRYTDPNWVARKLYRVGKQTCDWTAVFSGIRHWGIRNATTSALSPAETASAFFGVSTSLEHQTYPSGHNATPATRRRVTSSAQLLIQSSLQAFLDDAISKTVSISPNSTPHDIEGILWSAFNFKLKGVSVFRLHSSDLISSSL